MAIAALATADTTQGFHWGEPLPSPVPMPDRSLANGQLIHDESSPGEGWLEIENGTGHDAVITLARPGGLSAVGQMPTRLREERRPPVHRSVLSFDAPNAERCFCGRNVAGGGGAAEAPGALLVEVDALSGFDSFVKEVTPRLARAFVAAFGPARGEDALAAALGYAWEHHDMVTAMDNPAGYLYRVGQSRTRSRRQPPSFPEPASIGLPDVEPGLVSALRALSERQRVCVVLVFGFQWTHQEVADLLALSRSTVQNHVERGVEHLRDAIGVMNDA